MVLLILQVRGSDVALRITKQHGEESRKYGKSHSFFFFLGFTIGPGYFSRLSTRPNKFRALYNFKNN